MAITFLTNEDGTRLNKRMDDISDNPLSTKDERLLFMGDSIFSNYEGTPEELPPKVAHYLQVQDNNYYNCAIGGTTAAFRPDKNSWSDLSLQALITAMFEWIEMQEDESYDSSSISHYDIDNETEEYQEFIDDYIKTSPSERTVFIPFCRQYQIGNQKGGRKFLEKIRRLETLSTYIANDEGEKVLPLFFIDRLFIIIGSNDWYHNIPMLPPSDSKLDTSTYIGALNYVVKELQTKFPALIIYFVTPPMKFLIGINNNEDSDTCVTTQVTNSTGEIITTTREYTLRDYVEAYMKCAKDNHIPSIDIYNAPGINKYNWEMFHRDDEENGGKDGSHFNELGCHRIGRLIAECVKGGASSYNFEIAPEQEKRISNLENTVGNFNDALEATIALCDSYIGGESK